MIDKQDVTRDFIQKSIHEIPDELIPLTGGANNKVWKVTFHSREPVLLKEYFRDPLDQRDRMRSEILFLEYAWELGIRVIPKLLGYDFLNGCVLLQFIDGNRPEKEEIRMEDIKSSIDFFSSLNQTSSHRDNLPPASESCFSLQEHIHAIERRLNKLNGIQINEEIDENALKFVKHELIPIWKKVEESLKVTWQKEGINPLETLLSNNRCISPSDFGFHNALKIKTGDIYYIDFEYAGWDDPVKMICDFFCQPEVPVPERYMKYFIEKISLLFPDSQTLINRVLWLYPLYRIKWCCIILNEFLHISQKRRIFSDDLIKISDRKKSQLKKAQEFLYLINL